jgi:GTPase SAR1 family protein
MLNQITIVGVTGSGKTCFLAGMYKQMSVAKDGFVLSAVDREDTFTLKQYWKQVISNKVLPTSSFFECEFKLTQYCTEIQNGRFLWTDYAGGVLTGSDEEEYGNLKAAISNSQCILLVIDGEDFNVDADDIDEAEYIDKVVDNFDNRNIEINTNDALNALAEIIGENETNGNYIPIVVVVTKCDLIPKKLTENNFDIINRVFTQSNTFSALRGDSVQTPNRAVMVSAVTLGLEYPEKIRPLNFSEPIAFGILSSLRGYYRALLEQIDRNNLNLEKEEQKSDFIKFFSSKKREEFRKAIMNATEASNKALLECDKLLKLLPGKDDTPGGKTLLVGGKNCTVKDFFRM